MQRIMAKARVLEELPASPDIVWDKIQNFGDLSAWAPTGKVVHIEGKGEGAVRRVESPMGLFIERCAAHDATRKTFSYQLLESPLPFRNYIAVVTLRPLPGDKTEIEWSSEFDPGPFPEEKAIEQVEATYRNVFIANLRAVVSGK
jgi:hypothetical protein